MFGYFDSLQRLRERDCHGFRLLSTTTIVLIIDDTTKIMEK